MTGVLYRNNRITHNETENKTKQIKRYDIQANLHGNRFKGKALAADKDTGNGHPFVSDSDSLEGGFYGPQGDELGGKFLANDKKVLAVFSAKQKDGAEKPLAETFMDAYRIGADFVKKQIDSFGNVAKLLIDGVELALVPSEGTQTAFQHIFEKDGVKVSVCCSNLDYLHFGVLEHGGSHDMFLQRSRGAGFVVRAHHGRRQGHPSGRVPDQGPGHRRVRCQRFLKGETALIAAAIGGFVTAAASDGTPVALPEPTPKRDGSGVSLKGVVEALGARRTPEVVELFP